MNRALIAAGILAVAFAVRLSYQKVFRATGERVPLRVPFKQFPIGIAGESWTERSQPLDMKTARTAGVTDYINNYYEKDKVPIWFYAGYYDGKSVDGIHRPEICFPGAGWLPEKTHVDTLKVNGFGEILFNTIRFKKNNARKLTLYTFFYRGCFNPNKVEIDRGRIFGAKNFAILTIAADLQDSAAQTLEAGKTLMVELLECLLPRLLEHFPAADAFKGNKS